MSNDRFIAYFTMEIALEPGIPTYSGGLGALAGDTIRSAADLKVPMVVICLLHRKGYFYQRLDDQGNQVEEPVEWACGDFVTEMDARAQVSIEGREVRIRAWKYEVQGVSGYSVPVYLLDTSLPENSPWDQALTASLRPGQRKEALHRLRPAQPLSCGLPGNRPAHPGWRDRRGHQHRGELPPRALRHHRAQAGLQRTGMAVQHAIPLPLAGGRRRAAVAGAQPGPRELGPGQHGPGQMPRLGGPVDDDRADLRRRVRPSLGGLRMGERRADLRLLPDYGGLLRRLLEPGDRRQGQSLSPELPHLGRDELALAGPMRPVPGRARHALRRHPFRQAHQQRGLHGAQHNDRGHGAALLLHRQGGHGCSCDCQPQSRGPQGPPTRRCLPLPTGQARKRWRAPSFPRAAPPAAVSAPCWGRRHRSAPPGSCRWATSLLLRRRQMAQPFRRRRMFRPWRG